jgi:hypothetical protein
MKKPGPNAPTRTYADRMYRSPFAFTAGVLLLVAVVWMVVDALVRGTGRAPWLALAALLLVAPLVIGFAIRPVVKASDTRMLVRNPFRTITIPWAAVEDVRSGYSSEVLVGGRKFQLWSIPVSLRARNRAMRKTAKAAAEGAAGEAPVRSTSDQAIAELRELVERNAPKEGAQGEVRVRWAYEIIAPAVVGAIALVVLWAAG